MSFRRTISDNNSLTKVFPSGCQIVLNFAIEEIDSIAIYSIRVTGGVRGEQKNLFDYFYAQKRKEREEKHENREFFVKIPIELKEICTNPQIVSNDQDYCWYPRYPQFWRFINEIELLNFDGFYLWLPVCKPKNTNFQACNSNAKVQFRHTNSDKWKVKKVFFGVRKNNFFNEKAISYASSELLKAVKFWNQISPVQFEFTSERSIMHFCLDFDETEGNLKRYAYSFFPDQHVRGKISHLCLCPESFKPENVENLYKILLHELGHILGLCHTLSNQNNKPSKLESPNRIIDTIMDSDRWFEFDDHKVTNEDLSSARNALERIYEYLLTPDEFNQ